MFLIISKEGLEELRCFLEKHNVNDFESNLEKIYGVNSVENKKDLLDEIIDKDFNNNVNNNNNV